MTGDDRIRELEAELARVREKNRLLESVFTHAPDFLAHITLDGHLRFLNRFAPGLGPDDLVHATIYDFTDPADHGQVRAAIARLVETREQQSFESVAQGANRRPTPYFTRFAPVIDDDGVLRSVVLVATDVSRLKEAEAALAQSRVILQHVLTTSGMGAWWWDRATDDGGCDDATAKIFGLPSGESTTLELLLTRIHSDDRARVLAAIATAADTGSYGPIEHRAVRPDGTVRWVNASGRRMGPNETRIVGGTIDITERKQLEEQLAQAQKLESIGRLAGGIAHDFNNMLTAILSYNELALRSLPPGSPVARDLEQVRLAADRSIALTSQLLAFARQQITEPSISDLDTIVLGVDELLRRVLGANIEVVTLLHARQPVRVDVHQFEQVLLNLTTNARDAMPDGGRLTIETADATLHESTAATYGLPAGAYVKLAISDTGEGIPPQHIHRVFEPFFTTKDQGKGTGLGLATCYGIVTQNGGRILVESAAGKGTAFTIYLPRADGVPARSAPVEVTDGAGGTETLLVVEDEPSVRAAMVTLLERAGYRVLVAANGREALAIASDHAAPIDLLVTDVVMPQLGGAQLAQLLTESRPELAVLFVSGYTDNAFIHDGVLAGNVDLLHKPFSPGQLAARVRQALDRH